MYYQPITCNNSKQVEQSINKKSVRQRKQTKNITKEVKTVLRGSPERSVSSTFCVADTQFSTSVDGRYYADCDTPPSTSQSKKPTSLELMDSNEITTARLTGKRMTDTESPKGEKRKRNELNAEERETKKFKESATKLENSQSPTYTSDLLDDPISDTEF